MLEGPGHKQRAAHLNRAFRRASGPFRRRFSLRRLIWRGRDLGLVCFGVLLGALGVTMLDTARPQQVGDRVYYANCREAIQAGAAPIYYGSPAYRRPLDADGDGVACELYRGP
jgi:hypothetical protein